MILLIFLLKFFVKFAVRLQVLSGERERAYLVIQLARKCSVSFHAHAQSLRRTTALTGRARIAVYAFERSRISLAHNA